MDRARRTVACFAAALLCGQCFGATAFDAKITATAVGADTTTLSSTSMTVGASASLLVVGICFQPQAGTTKPTGVGVTWNGVAMTQQASVVNTNDSSYIFTLVNPASGVKTLAASWTNNQDVYMGAVSFTGTDTTTGINTSDTVTVNTTSASSITVPSSTDGATVATYCADGGIPTTNFTLFWSNASRQPGGAGTYHVAGTSNVHTFSAGGTHSALAGVHVIAAGSPPPPPSGACTISLLGAGPC